MIIKMHLRIKSFKLWNSSWKIWPQSQENKNQNGLYKILNLISFCMCYANASMTDFLVIMLKKICFSISRHSWKLSRKWLRNVFRMWIFCITLLPKDNLIMAPLWKDGNYKIKAKFLSLSEYHAKSIWWVKLGLKYLNKS